MHEATSLPPSILLSSLPSRDCPGGLNPLPNILMQFIQSNCLIKSTLMFSVYCTTEISLHAEFSHCRHILYYGFQDMTLKSGMGPCTFGSRTWRTHCQKVNGSAQDPRTPTGSSPLLSTL